MSLLIVTCSKQVRSLEISVGGAKRRGRGRCIECAVRRVVLEHMRGYLCENCNAGRKDPWLALSTKEETYCKR